MGISLAMTIPPFPAPTPGDPDGPGPGLTLKNAKTWTTPNPTRSRHGLRPIPTNRQATSPKLRQCAATVPALDELESLRREVMQRFGGVRAGILLAWERGVSPAVSVAA